MFTLPTIKAIARIVITGKGIVAWLPEPVGAPGKVPMVRERVEYWKYYPNYWSGYGPGPATPYLPMVHTPTDTAQLGFYYQHVPTWTAQPWRIPGPPTRPTGITGSAAAVAPATVTPVPRGPLQWSSIRLYLGRTAAYGKQRAEISHACQARSEVQGSRTTNDHGSPAILQTQFSGDIAAA
ncbi:MAG: hypothetical protein R3C12_05635 [Planctomycetaceae bacterium]